VTKVEYTGGVHDLKYILFPLVKISRGRLNDVGSVRSRNKKKLLKFSGSTREGEDRNFYLLGGAGALLDKGSGLVIIK